MPCGDGPPLVFVHGTPFSSFVWHRIAPYFTTTHRIRCPVQILWGEDDQWIPIERGQALHRMIPGSLFYPIPNAGHLVQEDAPEAVVAALMGFLPLQQSS